MFDNVAFINNFHARRPTIYEDDIQISRRSKYFDRYIREECPEDVKQLILDVINNHGLKDNIIEKINQMIEDDVMSDYVLPNNQEVVQDEDGYLLASYAINIFRCRGHTWINMTTASAITPVFKW